MAIAAVSPNPDTQVTRFQETPCTVVVSNNYDTAGVGSMTRADIAELTPSQLTSLFAPSGLFADMDSWFRTSFEMKACGIKTNGMYEWIMSSMRNIGNLMSIDKVDRGPSLLKPFVLGRQDSVINKDFWALTTGFLQSAYTAAVTGPLTSGQLGLGAASDRVIRVVSRYGITLTNAWFLSTDAVQIFGSFVGGQATRGQWKVLSSAAAADGSYIDVLVTSMNGGSSSIYDLAPTQGVLLALSNNVTDYESWCNNRPTLDPRKRVPYYFQTIRKGRKVDAEYMKVFSRLMESNKYFQEFGDLPLSERNRQDEEEFQHRFTNTFFWGKAISANQTMANWQSLEQITTVASGTILNPGLGNKLVGYRANMIGVYEQLKACGRVKDLQNNPLNLYELFDEIYRVVRARKSQGRTADSIDIYTDSQYAALFESAMINYYTKEYGGIVRINIETGGNVLGFGWRTYKVKYPIGVKINIITHEFFDDFQSAFQTEGLVGGSTVQAASGTFLLVLDMGRPGAKGGTIYPGMIATNRKKRTLGELEKLAAIDQTFACVLEYTTEEIMLESTTITAVVECPANSLWIENINRAVPTTVGETLNPTYANLY